MADTNTRIIRTGYRVNPGIEKYSIRHSIAITPGGNLNNHTRVQLYNGNYFINL